MNHPLAKGTRVTVAYDGCATCGPTHIQKISTRIVGVRHEDGTYFYVLLDGREVPESDIIEAS